VSSAATRQRQLRNLVIRLSQCLATLQPQAERVLRLRAGIGTAAPNSPRTVADIFHISRVHEARLEHAALVELQSAAREDRCGNTFPALIHVPAQNRLVSTDPVLTRRRHSSRRRRHSSRSVRAPRASVSVVGKGKAKLSFTLTAGKSPAAIKTLILTLPRGITFSTSKRHLVKGIVVEARSKRRRLTARLSRGKLTIKLRTSARMVRVTIASPAVTVRKTLAHKLKRDHVKTYQIFVTATNISHNTKRMVLRFNAK
jgi:hypothetical protein